MLPNPSGLIHGVLVVGALLAAESAQRETFAETVGGVVVALCLYWLVQAYSDFTEHRLEESRPLQWGTLGRTLVHDLMILAGAAVPLLAILICWGIGSSLGAAVTAAIWTSAGMIVALEVVAGIRADLEGRELIVQIIAGAMLGLLIIALKLVLH